MQPVAGSTMSAPNEASKDDIPAGPAIEGGIHFLGRGFVSFHVDITGGEERNTVP